MNRSRHPSRFWPAVEELESRLVPSGDPTPYEQLLLEELNDARANPAAYGAAIGLNLSSVAPSQPLAFDPRMVAAAEYHSQDMNANAYFAHTSPDGATPGDRLTAYGFPWLSYGESIAAGYPNTAAALEGLIIDTGVPDLGHRVQLLAMTSEFQSQQEVGIGVVLGGTGPYQNYFTIDTAVTNDTQPFLTGVVFNDANHNGKYDVGEGLGGVTVSVAGVASTTTFTAGGYSLQLPPGAYQVTFSGPGLPSAITRAVALGTQNVRLEITPSTPSVETAAQEAAWVAQQYQTLLHRAGSQAEINAWVNVLLAGAPQSSVTAAFLASTEFANVSAAWVRQQYTDLLKRPANATEVNAWVADMQQGTPAEQVSATIVGSLEYQRLQWGQWVTQAYQQLLKRNPNASEVTSWTNALQAGTTRAAMTAAIAASPEYAADLGGGGLSIWLSAVYGDLLGRGATASDLAAWGPMLQGGASKYSVAQLIAQSPEFLSDQARPYVQGLYQRLLGRSGSSAEVSGWVNAMMAGLTPEVVAVNFVLSNEYYQRALRNA